jgi:hypothetical protein
MSTVSAESSTTKNKKDECGGGGRKIKIYAAKNGNKFSSARKALWRQYITFRKQQRNVIKRRLFGGKGREGKMLRHTNERLAEEEKNRSN